MRVIAVAIAIATSCAAIAAPATAATKPPVIPAYVAAAVADASRPDADKVRDVNRKPAEVLAFAGVKPGDHVGELLPGGGYYSRLLCKVVGDKGTVQTINIARNTPPPAAPPAQPAAASPGQACTNVTAESFKIAELKLPDNLEVVWTSENYHDLRNTPFGADNMLAFNKMVFAALKPGGVFIVEDHNTAAGAGGTATQSLHRIEKATVISDVTAAGFKLDADSSLLVNPADDHSQAVFALKGTSDKFLLKFRKPR
jgi:predicted methyltransferase